jgi:hypothetical protein
MGRCGGGGHTSATGGRHFGDGLMEVGGGVEEAASMGGSSWGWTDGGGRRCGGGSIDGGGIDGERDQVNLIIWAGLGSGLVLILSLRRYMGWASMGRQHRCSFLLLHQINFIFKNIYIKMYLRIGFFYKICIAVSVSAGYRYTYPYPCCAVHGSNDSLMVLLPKTPQAESLKDYRPISLIHGIGKLILANRLATVIGPMVHPSQSAFIKGHSIHESFRFVHSSARLHVKKKPTVLLKVDLAKAFDSVAWSFLMEIFEHLGFSAAWREWVTNLLRSSSTRVLMNGQPSRRICHSRGLHQGDPLSPLLFILVMEVLGSLFRKADEFGLLHSLGVQRIPFHTSLYADDMIVFLAPVARDLETAKLIFQMFQGASGLDCNLNKCQLAPIRCSEEQVAMAVNHFPCQVMSLPIRYLGIPLSVTKLPRSAWQPLIDSVADKLPTWKGKLLHKSGRTTLIKSTLAAVPVHTSIGLELPPWVHKTLIKLMRSFLWTGSDTMQSGKCVVAWGSVQRPLSVGGLGIPDFKLMGLALRLRWL